MDLSRGRVTQGDFERFPENGHVPLRTRLVPMASFDVVRDMTRPFGKNSYIEVCRKRLTENGETSDFLLVTRGFFDGDGEKRWTRFVTLPDDEETKRWLADALLSI